MLRRHFHRWRRQRRTCGDDHVTQTLACCSCRGIAGCGRAGADFCFRLGRARLAPRRLGRSALLRRRPGLFWRLWLRRLLCAAIGPDTVGTPLAVGESLLLICPYKSEPRKPRPTAVGAFFEFDWWNSIRRFHQFQLIKCAIGRKPETIFVLGTWSEVSLKWNAKRNRHEQPNHPRRRTNRSQDVSIDL